MIHACRFHHPQNNLRAGQNGRPGPEAEFASLFARSYQRRFVRTHPGTTKPRTLFIREVPVHGNGIADLMVLSWRGDGSTEAGGRLDLAELDPTIRAFEIKMADWRSGLMQAHRYRYFSHVSLLVLPRDKLGLAKTHIDLFRALRVGLWGFDPESRAILTAYTPRPKRQHIEKHRQRALQMALQATRS